MPTDTSQPSSVPQEHGRHIQHHGPLYHRVLHLTRALHTYITMLALLLLFFFSLTGFVLNHEDLFGLDHSRQSATDVAIPAGAFALTDKLAIVEYFRGHHSVTGAVQPFDLPAANSAEPLHLTFKSPRCQTDIDFSPADGKATITRETRGVLALMAQLHTAKDAGAAWRLLLDATAILLFLSSLTGLILWYTIPRRRPIGLAALAVALFSALVLYFAFVP